MSTAPGGRDLVLRPHRMLREAPAGERERVREERGTGSEGTRVTLTDTRQANRGRDASPSLGQALV